VEPIEGDVAPISTSSLLEGDIEMRTPPGGQAQRQGTAVDGFGWPEGFAALCALAFGAGHFFIGYRTAGFETPLKMR
jgi:hypothetical protein